MASMMKDLPKIQERLHTIKDELSSIRVEAETGGGAVRVIAKGDMSIDSIKIDPAMMASLVNADSPEDHQMAEELVTGAVKSAMDRAREAAKKHLTDAANELGLPLPSSGLLGP